MKRASVVLDLFTAMLLGAGVIAQAPSSEIDTHIASARAAAGMDFRNTFVNLCLPAAGRGAPGGGVPQRAAAAGAAGTSAAARGTAVQGAAGRGAGGAAQTPDRANWYAPP